MYFDHVRCPSCGAQFDPESIATQGGAAVCPSCRSQLDVKSLFGVAAHLAEADSPDVGIDDLVAGSGPAEAWRSTGGYDPLRGQAPQGQRNPSRGPARGAPPGSTHMVRHGQDDQERAAPATGPSAVLRALREIKKG